MRLIRTRHRRGTALVLSLVLSLVITGLICALVATANALAQSSTQLANVDQAFFAAESGIQRVAWYAKHGTLASISSPLTGTVNGYAYSASWTTSSGTVQISSTASLGNVSYFMSQTVTPPAAPVPAFVAGGSNGNISGNMTVIGDLETAKDINGASNLTVTGNLKSGAALNGSPTVGGNLSVKGDCNGAPHVTGNMIVTGNINSSPVVTGNLAANGVINGSPIVGGTKTAHASNTVTVGSPPNVAAMVTSLAAAAGSTITNPSSITVLDFTASPNGVIYINGDATINANVAIFGSGTLVVKNNWNQSVKFPPAGTASIHLVVGGDLNVSGSLSLNGSLYGGNNWNQSGTFSITGITAVTKDMNISGAGTVTAASPPTFDSRAASSTLTFSNFTGPQP